MSSPIAESKLVTPGSLTVDVVLCAGVFVVLYHLVRSHVPSADPQMVRLWAGMTGGCMTGVFWLAVQMFRVVRRAQLAAAQPRHADRAGGASE